MRKEGGPPFPCPSAGIDRTCPSVAKAVLWLRFFARSVLRSTVWWNVVDFAAAVAACSVGLALLLFLLALQYTSTSSSVSVSSSSRSIWKMDWVAAGACFVSTAAAASVSCGTSSSLLRLLSSSMLSSSSSSVSSMTMISGPVT